ncbi:DUF4097 family beta strand repeat-containing protein [Ktedonobacter racemifer]|uniref:DUF4097 domain-containing protein n=1 Tax=Ktedonobacter racemifer DSM 44963 TaxID=485913 RepID=D6TT98_KTERA|nr:DUF4097 family beta strand repeat-containing protein [Ktedonobacter racemifer]EFH83649.1 hypothetical protein Krac_4641 [Ktedonobacter racemifer DSM 44963]
MQSQEGGHVPQEQTPFEVRAVNRDPREQHEQHEIPRSDDAEHGYEEGYTGQYTGDSWFQEGEKLQSRPPQQRGAFNIFLILGALCVAIILSNILGFLGSWIMWTGLVVLILVGVYLAILNWRVVTLPQPMETFQVQERARLILNNVSGNVTIRKGDQNAVTVFPTKRASGIGMTLEKMRIDYQQQGDVIAITSNANYSPFQFGMRNFDFEITVPRNCDIQLKTGSGRINAQGVSGEVRMHTGSGAIDAREMQGQIDLSTGSGAVDIADLDGRINIRTSSGGMTAHQVRGEVLLKSSSGRISATSMDGRVELNTGSGEIYVIQSTLSGRAIFKTGSGTINFGGALDPLGTYQFRTGSGEISLTLPPQSAFNLDASTGSGKITNEFGGNDVGGGPHAQIKTKTGSGRITIRSS